MDLRKLNIDPNPDYSRIKNVLTRDNNPDRVPLFELFSNIEEQVLNRIELKPVPFQSAPDETDPVEMNLKNHITYMYNLGYDYINASADNAGFPQKLLFERVEPFHQIGIVIHGHHVFPV